MKKIRRLLIKITVSIVGVIVLVLIIAQMSGAFNDKVEPGKAPAELPNIAADAELATVIAEERPIFEEAAGAVQAVKRTVVSSRILATIKTINVRAGDRVEAGDVLAVLDDRDLALRVEQAREALNSAQARLTNAEAEYRRHEKLFADGVSTRRDFDAAEAAWRVAEAEVSGASQALEEANVIMTYSEIKAPVGGRVVERLAEPGDMASPGIPLLQLYDPSTLQLEAAVPESLATKLKIGQPLEVRVDALNKTFQAEIDEIVPQSEVGSRVFRVKARLPQDERLYTGMFGRLIIPVGQRQVLLVPVRAVETIGQNHFVHTVGDDRTSSRRMVILGGLIDDEHYEVLAGLRAGERVLLR